MSTRNDMGFFVGTLGLGAAAGGFTVILAAAVVAFMGQDPMAPFFPKRFDASELAAAAAEAREEAYAQFDAWARETGCLERHTGYDGHQVDVWTCAPVPGWRRLVTDVE